MSFEDLMDLQTKPKLILILDNLNLTQVAKALSSNSNKGPTGYNPEAILRALFAQQIESIPTRAALVRRLKSDPVFRYCCGFHVAGSVPSEATFSRYYAKLANSNSLRTLFYQLVDQAIEMEVIDTETLAIDATKLESYERAKPKSKVDKNNSNTPDWGSKFDSHHNQITWFGWKVHLVSDCKGELPVDFVVTPANEADSTPALPLVDMVYQRFTDRDFQTPKYWTMDSGYDVKEIYTEIHQNYNAQAIIPINKRNAKQPPAGFYDFKGTPICSGGHKMVYWGHYNGCNKFRCPHVLGKVECCHGSAWCSDSNYGRVVKTKIKDNPKFISIPHRDSKGWQEIYNKRTSVERTFSRLKEHLNLKNLTVMGAEKVETHVLLSCISLITSKIALKKQEDRTKITAAA